MSKKNKKKKGWQQFLGWNDPYDDDYYGAYNYDWNTQLSDKRGNESKEEATFDKLTGGKWSEHKGGASWENQWKEYEDTGVWRGYSYYVKPTLDYRYVEQMANAFASSYNVKVEVANAWATDIKTKTLFYNPTTLLYGTKGELIASLLHEIGHLQYTSHPDDMVSPTYKKFPQQMQEVVNVFEDLRIDKIMAKAYSGAEDIFECNKPIIKNLAKQFNDKGNAMVKTLIDRTQNTADGLVNYQPQSAEEMRQWKTHMKTYFGSDDKDTVKAKLDATIAKFKKALLEKDTLFHYCEAMLLTGYGETVVLQGKMLARVEATKHVPELGVKSKNTQQLVDHLERDVIPVIKDLFQADDEFKKDLQSLFGGTGGADAVENIMDSIANEMAQLLDGSGNDKKGNPKVRGNGTKRGYDANAIPKDWADGDYGAIKQSVQSAIDDLLRRLRFLKTEEEAIRYEGAKRRGRLDGNRAYRFRMNDMRLFNQKAPQKQTLKQFAFSLMVDISGSMSGNRIIQATRGLVMFSEVCEEMKIPYEILTFDDRPTVIKNFKDTLDTKMKKRIGGVAKANGGGTYLLPALQASEIRKRPEAKKIAVILSDGGVGDHREHQKYFDEWRKDRVQEIGVGIDCGEEIKQLCRDRGVSLDTPQQLPQVFEEIMNRSILRSKR